ASARRRQRGRGLVGRLGEGRRGRPTPSRRGDVRPEEEAIGDQSQGRGAGSRRRLIPARPQANGHAGRRGAATPKLRAPLIAVLAAGSLPGAEPVRVRAHVIEYEIPDGYAVMFVDVNADGRPDIVHLGGAT